MFVNEAKYFKLKERVLEVDSEVNSPPSLSAIHRQSVQKQLSVCNQA